MCVGIGQRGWSLKLASPERFNARMAAACFSHEAWDWDPLAHDPCLSVADLDRLLDVGHHPSEVGSLVAVLRHPAMRRRPRRSLLRRLHWTLCDQVLREAPELAALPGVASVVAEVPLCLTTVAWRGVLRHAPDRQRATLWRAYAAADPDAVVAMLRVITIEEPALLPRAATVALLSASDPNVRLATMQVLDHLVAADAQVSARRSAGGGVHEDTVRA
jgi:hypothetical protein